MPEAENFSEYRQLILAHISSANRRQDAVENQITDLKVAMGVLVVKVSFVVSLIVLVGGGVATWLVKASLDSVVANDQGQIEAAVELRRSIDDAQQMLRDLQRRDPPEEN